MHTHTQKTFDYKLGTLPSGCHLESSERENFHLFQVTRKLPARRTSYHFAVCVRACVRAQE